MSKNISINDSTKAQKMKGIKYSSNMFVFLISDLAAVNPKIMTMHKCVYYIHRNNINKRMNEKGEKTLLHSRVYIFHN